MQQDELIDALSWPGNLDDSQVSILLRRARDLLAPIGLAEATDNSPAVEELESLFGTLDSKDLIDSYWVAALLSSGSDPDIDPLASHVVAAALEEARGKTPDYPRPACRAVRQIYRGKQPEIHAALPSMPMSSDARAELEWLRGERVALKGVAPKSKGRMPPERALSLIARLLTRYVTDERRSHDPDGGTTRHVRDDPSCDDTDIGKTQLYRWVNERLEEHVDDAPVRVDVEPSGPAAHRRSLPMQRYYTKAAAQRVVRGGMLSPIRWGVFSPASLGGLTRQLRAGVAKGGSADALLLISLLTGRPVDHINRLPVQRWRDDRQEETPAPRRQPVREAVLRTRTSMALRTGIALPPPKGDNDTRQHYEQSRSVMNVPLPRELLTCLPSTKKPPIVPPEEMNERLASLRRELPQVTPSRIAMAGYQWLLHAGHERTLLDRLFGTPLAHATPLYYEATDASRILGVYRAWAKHLNECIPDAPLPIPDVTSQSLIGSRRTPTTEWVQGLFRSRRRLLIRQRRSAPFDIAHNSYALYTYLVLAVATALRPVRQPFETVRDYCPASRTYFIQDKDAGGVPSPRFVPLAPVAVKQLQFYLDYLDDVDRSLVGHGKLGTYVKAACSGQVPYLFAIQPTEPTPRPVQWGNVTPTPLTPTRVAELLGPNLTLNLNWNRHFLRTQLAARGVPDRILAAFMGHGQLEQRAFTRFSATTIPDLQSVAVDIERLAQDLKITPIPPPRWPLLRT